MLEGDAAANADTMCMPFGCAQRARDHRPAHPSKQEAGSPRSVLLWRWLWKEQKRKNNVIELPVCWCGVFCKVVA